MSTKWLDNWWKIPRSMMEEKAQQLGGGVKVADPYKYFSMASV
jgi:hypothetical protein